MTFKTTPKWVSYERQAHLVRLFVNYPDNPSSTPGLRRNP